MKHIQFGLNSDSANIAILIKRINFDKKKLIKEYINPSGLDEENFFGLSLSYNRNNKAPAKLAKAYIQDELLPEIKQQGLTTLLVADAPYFKFLVKKTKTTDCYGDVYSCAVEGYEYLNVILVPNYHAVFHNPDMQKKIDFSLKVLNQFHGGNFSEKNYDVIHSSYYPDTVSKIKETLKALLTHKELTVDIEAWSLKFYDAGIATISFAWDKHNGVAFEVDYFEDYNEIKEIRNLLKEFFTAYTGKLIYHGSNYDMKVLVYELWMRTLTDYVGMIQGIDIICRNFEDSKLIAYCATNNAVKNELGLKGLAVEFAGNYGQEDINDIDLIPRKDLLEYNLIDTLSTWFVCEEYLPILIQDKQRDLYENILKPSVKTILQTELCGMPVDMDRVREVDTIISDIIEDHQQYFKDSAIVQKFNEARLVDKAAKKTTKAKKKIYTVEDVYEDFNPNSNVQLQGLIFEYMGYPVIDKTDKGNPSTGKDTIEKLVNHAKTPEHKELFERLVILTQATKIKTDFIPTLLSAQQLPDGSYRLYGNFNIGGTKSLRLSSSKPNLQNLPSNSLYASLVKSCFISPKGWLFIGSDFDALEDKVGALLTRDPNKLKVYTDGFDGHCLRAHSYFGDQMPLIKDTSVQSINSIKKLYKDLRQSSKAPTFALAYQGTYYTLMQDCGFSKKKAKMIEKNYHDLYQVADQWTAAILKEAGKTGYVPLAFGGRIRTPLMKQALMGSGTEIYAAKKEARSAGNAATQSYCVLTMRAFNEFMGRVHASEYRYDIMPSGTIHDAIYLVIKNKPEILKWVNDELIDCMAWQDLPELQHDTIKISAELDVYYPNWSNAITLKNNQTKQQITDTCNKGYEEYLAAA